CKSCDFAAQPDIASAQITSASLNFTFDSLLLGRLYCLNLSDPFDCPALGLAGLGLRLSLGLGKLPDDPLGPHVGCVVARPVHLAASPCQQPSHRHRQEDLGPVAEKCHGRLVRGHNEIVRPSAYT